MVPCLVPLGRAGCHRGHTLPASSVRPTRPRQGRLLALMQARHEARRALTCLRRVDHCQGSQSSLVYPCPRSGRQQGQMHAVVCWVLLPGRRPPQQR